MGVQGSCVLSMKLLLEPLVFPSFLNKFSYFFPIFLSRNSYFPIFEQTCRLTPWTFQDCAANLFNSLPKEIRNCTDLWTFIRKFKGHLSSVAKDDLDL